MNDKYIEIGMSRPSASFFDSYSVEGDLILTCTNYIYNLTHYTQISEGAREDIRQIAKAFKMLKIDLTGIDYFTLLLAGHDSELKNVLFGRFYYL